MRINGKEVLWTALAGVQSSWPQLKAFDFCAAGTASRRTRIARRCDKLEDSDQGLSTQFDRIFVTTKLIAAKTNIKHVTAAAKRKRILAKLPKKTRTALGKEGAKAARRKRRKWVRWLVQSKIRKAADGGRCDRSLMKARTFFGHTKGILISDPDAPESNRRIALADEDIVALAHDPRNASVMLAGSYGRGLFRSSDGGTKWKHVDLDVEYVRTITFSDCEPQTVYLGIEPAELFRSRDSGESWECLHIRRLPEAADWTLPYSPRSGALRTVALHPALPRIIYGGVEQGGVLKSTDSGESWRLHCRRIDQDVHWLSMNRAQPDVLLAATGDGLFLTKDGAASWSKLIDDYIRAVVIHPLDPALAFAAPAHEVGEHGWIVRSTDGGENWELASEGLKLPTDDMIESFEIDPHDPDWIFAICSEGGLLRSSVHKPAWQVIPCDAKVQCLDFCETN